MQKKLFALLLALAMIMSLLTGCGDSNAPAADGEGEDTSTSTDATEGDTTPALTEVPEEAWEDPVAYLTDGAMSSGDVVMTVNGVDVTADTYVYWLCYQYTYASYYYAQYGMTLDPTQTVDDNGTTIAQSLADQSMSVAKMNTILRTRAEEDALALSEDQQDRLKDLEDVYADEDNLLFYGTNLDVLKQAYTDSCLATNLKDFLFGEGGEMEPTEETLKDYAQEHGTYTCRYILLNTNDLDEDDEEGREAQRQLAENLLTQLQAYSADELEEKFTELQEEYNTSDGNTERYTFDNDDSLVTGFREKLAEMDVGELGMTDETDYGYFVLLRLDTDLDALSEDYSIDTYDSLVAQWVDEADVTTTDAMDNLDVTTFYDKLAALQDVLSAKMAEESAAESENTEDADTTDTDTTDAETDTTDTDTGDTENTDTVETETQEETESTEPVG